MFSFNAKGIKKAYLQVELNPDDRDVTRFLWLKDINLPYSKENVQAFRFCRVIWGIICSAFILTIGIMKYNNAVSNDIMNNMYVDNLITGVLTEAEGVAYY